MSKYLKGNFVRQWLCIVSLRKLLSTAMLPVKDTYSKIRTETGAWLSKPKEHVCCIQPLLPYRCLLGPGGIGKQMENIQVIKVWELHQQVITPFIYDMRNLTYNRH